MIDTTACVLLPPDTPHPAHMGTGFRQALLLASLLYCALFPGYAHRAYALPPQRFVLSEPATHTRNTTLFADISVDVDNEDGLRDLLKDGATLQLMVNARLERQRAWWVNEPIANSTFISTLRHDPLSRDFLMYLPTPDGNRNIRDRNLTRVLYASWRNLSLPVVALNLLQQEKQDTFVLILDFSLRHAEAPPWLEKSFLFWSADIVPPASTRLELNFSGNGQALTPDSNAGTGL